MAEDSSNSGGRVRFRASATYGTPPGRRRGLGVRWVLVLVVFGIFAWASRDQIGNLVFARGGSSTRPSGEWVGEMNITGNYDVATHSMKPDETQHSRAVVYMKLEGTDSFMHEYGGDGELVLEGDPTRHPLHVGALRIADDGVRVTSGVFEVPHLTGGVQGTYAQNAFHLKDYGSFGLIFTVDFRRGTYQEFQARVATL